MSGNHPKGRIQHSEHSDSLKSRTLSLSHTVIRNFHEKSHIVIRNFHEKSHNVIRNFHEKSHTVIRNFHEK